MEKKTFFAIRQHNIKSQNTLKTTMPRCRDECKIFEKRKRAEKLSLEAELKEELKAEN